MNYRTLVKLEARAYVKQLEDCGIKLEEIKQDVLALFGVRVLVGECIETLAKAVDVEGHKAKGRLILAREMDSGYCVAIRSQHLAVVVDDFSMAEDVIQQITKEFPQKFAVINIIREYLTEVSAF